MDKNAPDQLAPNHLPQKHLAPVFVLTRPQMGENIGASARAMLNFGLDRMRLIDPRDGWPNPAAMALASGAGRVLDGVQIFDDLSAGLADCDYVFATTARQRDLTKRVMSPEAAMRECFARAGQGQRVAMVFGPERSGLENQEVSAANALVTIPVNPEFPSLNLAQSVLLLGYEWRRASAEIRHDVMEMAGADWADASEIDHLARHFEERLDHAGFFFPQAKAQSMKVNLRNMWSRLPLTRADVQTLHGMLRQLLRATKSDS